MKTSLLASATAFMAIFAQIHNADATLGSFRSHCKWPFLARILKSCKINVVVFGDSTSDIGTSNAGSSFSTVVGAAAGLQNAPRPELFFESSFTNRNGGWNRQLMDKTWSNVYTYAHGRARAAGDLERFEFCVNQPNATIEDSCAYTIPGAMSQVALFARDNIRMRDGDIVAFLIGSNDILAMLNKLIADQVTDPAEVQSRVLALVNSVTMSIGASIASVKNTVSDADLKFVVFNLPTRVEPPLIAALPASTRGLINNIVVGMNQGLAQLAASIPGVEIFDFDNAVYNFALSSPLQQTGSCGGLTSACNPLSCPAPCSNPNDFFFIDELHVTSGVHGAVMDAFVDQVGGFIRCDPRFMWLNVCLPI